MNVTLPNNYTAREVVEFVKSKYSNLKGPLLDVLNLLDENSELIDSEDEYICAECGCDTENQRIEVTCEECGSTNKIEV